jgi:hypothetical protein
VRNCRRRLTPIRAADVAVTAEDAILEIEKTGNAFPALKDIEEIQEILPHRYMSIRFWLSLPAFMQHIPSL